MLDTALTQYGDVSVDVPVGLGHKSVNKERGMGSLQDRYAIYAEQARQLGWPVKSYEEWLNS